MKDEIADYREQMVALDLEFASLLPGRLHEVERLWRSLAEEGWNRETLRSLVYQVHILSGSAGTFGYPELSQNALALERCLKPWTQLEQAPDEQTLDDVPSLIEALRRSAELRFRAEPIRTLGTASEGSERRLIYIVEDELSLASELGVVLASFDYEVKVFPDTQGVAAAIAEERPDALVIDIILPEGDLAGVDLLKDLRQKLVLRTLPVLFITARRDMEARLAAAHWGGAGYFVKPLDVISLVDRLNRLTRPRDVQPFRVLIVDDDRKLAEHYALVLRHGGMQVSVLTRPLEILDRLDEERPELVLMDINMPECSGVDLVNVIRQFDSYVSLPIVYLSTETDLERQISALRMGGDDFLTKPLTDYHLVAAVEIRAQRSRDLGALMTRDGLTGLLNHAALKDRLAAELARSGRKREKLAFAMLDVDKFKRVNDRHGHLAGDRVLRILAELLRQRVRLSDTVGRYGGEEFGIILADCGIEDAVRVVDKLRESFGDIRFGLDEERYKVTFSAGVALAEPGMSVDDLVDRADQALLLAKRQGRNRVQHA